MVRAWLKAGIIFMALLGLWGCGAGAKAPVVDKPQNVVEQAKVILNEYAQGGPMGSEAARFEDIVEELKKTDPQKATILEKGFADIKKSPNSRQAKARELLKQL